MTVTVQTPDAMLRSLSEHRVVEGFAYGDLAWVVDQGEPETVRCVAVTDPGIGIGEGKCAAVAGSAKGGIRRPAERIFRGRLEVAERVHSWLKTQDHIEQAAAGGWAGRIKASSVWLVKPSPPVTAVL